MVYEMAKKGGLKGLVGIVEKLNIFTAIGLHFNVPTAPIWAICSCNIYSNLLSNPLII
jgi:hypothetical protein